MRLSVIIPTLWLTDTLDKSLEQLDNSPYVSEIILINNNYNNTPSYYKSDKIRIHTPPTNIYVSKAWNYGVRVAKEDYICILNDDVVLNDRVLEYMASIKKPRGITGLAFGSINGPKVPIKISETVEMPYAYACCMFLHKKSYVPIPEGINIVYGDNYLFNTIPGPHYQLHCSVEGTISTSIKKMWSTWAIDTIMEQDRLNYERIINAR